MKAQVSYKANELVLTMIAKHETDRHGRFTESGLPIHLYSRFLGHMVKRKSMRSSIL